MNKYKLTVSALILLYLRVTPSFIMGNCNCKFTSKIFATASLTLAESIVCALKYSSIIFFCVLIGILTYEKYKNYLIKRTPRLISPLLIGTLSVSAS